MGEASIEKLLSAFEPIALEQMESVRLMNRIDTKYVTTLPLLIELLRLACGSYRVQEIAGVRNQSYRTLYYDTCGCDMFFEHERGRKARQKIRIRSYENSAAAFLEVKTKNNKGRTNKKRVPLLPDDPGIEAHTDFLRSCSRYEPRELYRQIENSFSRITLVNDRLTERLTIDTGLTFRNLATGSRRTLAELVVVELKREGNTPSAVLDMLWRLRIHPCGFSKYCMGMALTNDRLKQNRLKPRIRAVDRLCGTAQISG